MRGPLMNALSYGALTVAQNDVTILDDIYIEAGTQGLIVDVFHTSAGSATMVYIIQGYHYTSGITAWTQSYTDLLTSAALNKDVGIRLVIDPRVTAVTNTHAQTVLPYKLRIRGNVDTATATGVYVAVTQVC